MEESLDINEPSPIPDYIQEVMHNFKKAVGAFVDEFTDPNLQTRAVIIEDGVQTGKTSFLAAVAYGLQQGLAAEQVSSQVFLTTAGLQQTAGLSQILPEDRTGIKYDKLPKAEELAALNGKIIIVLDEISQLSPNPYMWPKYINLPNTLFLVAAHPNSPYFEEWKKLFPKAEVITMDQIKELNGAEDTR